MQSKIKSKSSKSAVHSKNHLLLSVRPSTMFSPRGQRPTWPTQPLTSKTLQSSTPRIRGLSLYFLFSGARKLLRVFKKGIIWPQLFLPQIQKLWVEKDLRGYKHPPCGRSQLHCALITCGYFIFEIHLVPTEMRSKCKKHTGFWRLGINKKCKISLKLFDND